MKIFGKRILSLALATCLSVFTLTAIGNAQTIDQFKDFPNDWSTEAVTAAVNNGLLKGYGDDTIRPRGLLKRAEMAAVINRAFGAVIPADISAYKDVSSDSWYYSDIAKAVNMGTFEGTGSGNMNPERPITREETFAVIARAMVLTGGNTAVLDKFADKASISAWAVDSIASLAEKGYVNGDGTNLNPKKNITRAEFATLMHNIFKQYYSKPGTYTTTVNGCLMINVGGVRLSNTTINGDLVLGDGAHTGNIYLDNVVVNGRILVRGPQKPGMVKITKAASTGGVVVKNVNGIVYFDNYKTEAIFKNIKEYTPAEFKKKSASFGGVGSGTTSKEKYTITFDTKGGTPIDSVTKREGTVVDLSEYVTTRDGYRFDGWYLDDDYNEEDKVESIKLKKNVTVYAKWVKQWKVTFDLNGGTELLYNGEPTDKLEVIADEGTFSLEKYEASKNGDLYFVCWQLDGNNVVDPYEIKLDGNKTVVAQWSSTEPAKHSLTFDLNGGTELYGPAGKLDQYTLVDVPEGQFPLYDYEAKREGYDFTGWYSDSECKNLIDDDSFTLTANTTVYAGWEKSKEEDKLIFNLKADEKLFKGDDEIIDHTLKPIPDNFDLYDYRAEKEGYRFTGWYSDSECKNLIPDDGNFKVNGTTNVYPGFIKVWKVYFNNCDEIAPKEYDEGATVKIADLPDATNKKNVDFDAWYDKDGNLATDIANITSDIHLYARWNATINFFINEGDETPYKSITKNAGYSVKLEEFNPTKVNYRLDGWYTNDNSYSIIGTVPVNENTDIYAKWVRQYTIKFVTNCDGVTFNPVTKDEGSTPLDLSTYTIDDDKKPGKKFTGWYWDKDCKNPIADGKVPFDNDYTIYAGWRDIESYTLTLISYDDIVFETIVRNEDTGFEVDLNVYVPGRTGYEFTGWYEDKECTTIVDPYKFELKANTTYYAGWKEEPIPVTKYTVTFVNGKVWDASSFKFIPNVVTTFTVEEGKAISTAIDKWLNDKGEYYSDGKYIGLATTYNGMPAVYRTNKQADSSGTTPKYIHNIPQYGWFNNSKVEFTSATILDDTNTTTAKNDGWINYGENRGLTLFPGWKVATITGDTTRIDIPSEVPTAFELYYAPDERVIDAATDLIFINRGAVIKALTTYDSKIYNNPYIAKFITPQKQFKVINLNLSFSQIFRGTDNFKKVLEPIIDKAMEKVPTSLQADVRAKIDEAVTDIAEDKLLTLKDGNMPINMKLSELLGSETTLRSIIDDAIDTALIDAPQTVKDEIADEITEIKEFIIASDITATPLPSRDVHFNEIKYPIADLYGGKDALVADIKAKINEKLVSAPESIQTEISTKVGTAIDNIFTKTTWYAGNSANNNGITTVNLTLKPSEIKIGGKTINELVQEKILENMTPSVKAAFETYVNPIVTTLLPLNTWDITNPNYTTEKFNVSLSLKDDILRDNFDSYFNTNIGTKIDNISTRVTFDNAYDEVANPDGWDIAKVKTTAKELLSADKWDFDAIDTKDIAVTSTPFYIRDAFGGATGFKNEIIEKLKEQNASFEDVLTSQSSIETAIGNIAGADKWSLAYQGGYADLNFSVPLKKIIKTDTLKSNLLTQYPDKANDINELVSAIDGGNGYMITDTEIISALKAYIDTVNVDFSDIKSTYSDIAKADAYLGKDIVENEVVGAKEDYSDNLSTFRVGDKLPTVIIATYKHNLNEDFLIAMQSKLDEVNYYNNDTIKNDVKIAAIRDVVGEESIATAIDTAKTDPTYGFNKQLTDAINGAEIGSYISIKLNINLNEILLKKVSEYITNLSYKDAIKDADLRTFVTETMYTNQVQKDYNEKITSELNGKNTENTISSAIDVKDIQVNVAEQMLKKLREYIFNLKYSDLGTTQIEEVVGTQIKDQFGDTTKGIKKDYLDRIDVALKGDTPLNNQITFTNVKIDVTELLLKELQKKVDALKTDENILNSVPEKIKDIFNDDEYLKGIVVDALDIYSQKITPSLSPSYAEFDSDISLYNVDINVTEVVMNGMIDKLRNDIKWATYGSYVPIEYVTLLGEDYLAGQFEKVAGDMADAIEDVKTNTSIKADVFRVKLDLDVYDLLMQRIDEHIDTTFAYDNIVDKVPDRFESLIKLVGEDILRREYSKFVGSFSDRIDIALGADKEDASDNAETLDCAIIISVDPILILREEYARYSMKVDELLKEKFSDKYNEFKPEIDALIAKSNPEYLLEKVGEPNDIYTGYALKDYNFYYDALEESTLLTDKLIQKLSTAAVDSGKLNEFVEKYVDLGYDVYYKAMELANKALDRTTIDEKFDIDRFIPSDEFMEKQRARIKEYAVKIVENPNITVKDAIELAFEKADINRPWGEFEETFSKKQETVTIKNKTYVPDIGK